jgi:hypothetical protein
MIALDHVTLGTSSLAAGIAAVRDVLGIEIPPGGKHPDMSTHNRVVNVGESRFLELIAVDPDAPAVPHKRWFGLDDPAVKARIAAAPRGVGWVVRTDDLDHVIATSPVELGEARRMSRGERTWRLTVPEAGAMPYDGLVPGVHRVVARTASFDRHAVPRPDAGGDRDAPSPGRRAARRAAAARRARPHLCPRARRDRVARLPLPPARRQRAHPRSLTR